MYGYRYLNYILIMVMYVNPQPYSNHSGRSGKVAINLFFMMVVALFIILYVVQGMPVWIAASSAIGCVFTALLLFCIFTGLQKPAVPPAPIPPLTDSTPGTEVPGVMISPPPAYKWNRVLPQSEDLPPSYEEAVVEYNASSSTVVMVPSGTPITPKPTVQIPPPFYYQHM